VAATGLAVLWAAVTRSAAPLAAILLLVPVSGLFLLADRMLVNRWRSELDAAWTRRDIDLSALSGAIRAMPALPKETVEGMLAALPLLDDPSAERNVLAPTRRAVAGASEAWHRSRTHLLLIDTTLSGVAVACLLAATYQRTPAPLLGLTVLALRPLLGARIERRFVSARDAALEACRGQEGFDEADYARMVAGLR
jgi:hypothetical protein